jgi:hypothetical protein
LLFQVINLESRMGPENRNSKLLNDKQDSADGGRRDSDTAAMPNAEANKPSVPQTSGWDFGSFEGPI